MITRCLLFAWFCSLGACANLLAGVGDPQVATDHPWYPGELAISTFDRLLRTERDLYQRTTGEAVVSDEQKALAAWHWRNTHYFHGEDGKQDLWGKGFSGGDTTNREYWTGLFAYGFSLCGTTHAQWTAEMEAALGHGRGRVVGVNGHNSFEVFLTGGSYGNGKWVLLDHDLSTVVFNRDGTGLASLPEIKADLKNLTDRRFLPERQRGWLVSGLHEDDAAGVFDRYTTAEYFSGYAGPPPMVHLRRGERLRRYLAPGLADGKTFVFWGRNYNAGGIAGPERDRTWVNQPEKMYKSQTGTPSRRGQARFGNAVYTYRPDFTSGDYREAVVDEGDGYVTFGFLTPYVIAATPPNEKPWGIYDGGCKNGLVISTDVVADESAPKVWVSVDRGKTWSDETRLRNGLDLTDAVKGYRQYFLRFGASARDLAKYAPTITTVCQANPATMPRLSDRETTVRFRAGGKALVSAGLTLPEANAHVIVGRFGTPKVTLELATPNREPAIAIYAAGHVASSNPPRSDIKYQIEHASEGSQNYAAIIRDWTIPRRGEEPADFWSQSFCYGGVELKRDDPKMPGSPIRVRFANDGGKSYLRAEAHVVYALPQTDATRVTFAWTDSSGQKEASHTFPGGAAGLRAEQEWSLVTGENVVTRWVEYEASFNR